MIPQQPERLGRTLRPISDMAHDTQFAPNVSQLSWRVIQFPLQDRTSLTQLEAPEL